MRLSRPWRAAATPAGWVGSAHSTPCTFCVRGTWGLRALSGHLPGTSPAFLAGVGGSSGAEPPRAPCPRPTAGGLPATPWCSVPISPPGPSLVSLLHSHGSCLIPLRSIRVCKPSGERVTGRRAGNHTTRASLSVRGPTTDAGRGGVVGRGSWCPSCSHSELRLERPLSPCFVQTLTVVNPATGLDPRAGGRGLLHRSDSGSCVLEARRGRTAHLSGHPCGSGLASPGTHGHLRAGHCEPWVRRRGWRGAALTCLLSVWEVAAT